MLLLKETVSKTAAAAVRAIDCMPKRIPFNFNPRQSPFGAIEICPCQNSKRGFFTLNDPTDEMQPPSLPPLTAAFAKRGHEAFVIFRKKKLPPLLILIVCLLVFPQPRIVGGAALLLGGLQ